jgi:hypothetical protein
MPRHGQPSKKELLRQAKREAGICIEPICGSRAVKSWDYCLKHTLSSVSERMNADLEREAIVKPPNPQLT